MTHLNNYAIDSRLAIEVTTRVGIQVAGRVGGKYVVTTLYEQCIWFDFEFISR